MLLALRSLWERLFHPVRLRIAHVRGLSPLRSLLWFGPAQRRLAHLDPLRTMTRGPHRSLETFTPLRTVKGEA